MTYLYSRKEWLDKYCDSVDVNLSDELIKDLLAKKKPKCKHQPFSQKEIDAFNESAIRHGFTSPNLSPPKPKKIEKIYKDMKFQTTGHLAGHIMKIELKINELVDYINNEIH